MLRLVVLAIIGATAAVPTARGAASLTPPLAVTASDVAIDGDLSQGPRSRGTEKEPHLIEDDVGSTVGASPESSKPIMKGKDLVTPKSGCELASFCVRSNNDLPSLIRFKVPSSWPVVYVENALINKFVPLLARLSAPIVMISGMEMLVHCCDYIDAYGYGPREIARILESKNVQHWYMMNPNFRHPKVSGWPYGVQSSSIDSILATWDMNISRVPGAVYRPYLGVSHRPNREGLITERKTDHKSYLKRLRQVEYVLSPDGDRPDCYRNYEALALGTCAVTEMNAHLYSFLNGTGMLFDEDMFSWNEHGPKGRCMARPVMSTVSYWRDRLNASLRTRHFKW